jgi:hypothetical protein
VLRREEVTRSFSTAKGANIAKNVNHERHETHENGLAEKGDWLRRPDKVGPASTDYS